MKYFSAGGADPWLAGIWFIKFLFIEFIKIQNPPLNPPMYGQIKLTAIGTSGTWLPSPLVINFFSIFCSFGENCVCSLWSTICQTMQCISSICEKCQKVQISRPTVPTPSPAKRNISDLALSSYLAVYTCITYTPVQVSVRSNVTDSGIFITYLFKSIVVFVFCCYQLRMRVGNNFTHVCLCVCLSV